MTVAITGHGFSSAADYIDVAMRKSMEFLHKSSALGIESVLRDELADAWTECQEADWDGHGALPISQDAWLSARNFLEAWPLGVCRPTIGADPHGYISLEWYNNPRRVLSVSISPDEHLHYAALMGASNVCGTEIFFGEVPDVIIDLVRRVYA